MRYLIIVSFVFALFLSGCTKESAQKPAAQPEKKAQPAAPAAAPQKVPKEAAQPAPEEKKSDIEFYAYESKGRRDPFVSIIEASKKDRETEKKKRALKPYESYDVMDIRVIALARDHNKYYAMIQLPDKKYFTVREGMTLGLYGGKVVRIDAEGVVVREHIKDYRGEIQPRDTILKLHKEEG